MNLNKYGLDLEISDLWYTPFWQNATFYLLLAALGFLILFLVIWLIIRKNRKEMGQDPIDKLINKVYNLELGEDGLDYQIFYLELIEYVKEFADLQHNLKISSYTDTEVKRILKKKNIDKDFNDLVFHLFDSSEKIRFASDLGNREQMKKDLQQVLAVFESYRV